MLDKINIDFLSVYFLRFILSLSLFLSPGAVRLFVRKCLLLFGRAVVMQKREKATTTKKEKREERIRQQQQPEKSKIIRSNKIESETNEWTADSFVFMRACNGRNMYDDD